MPKIEVGVAGGFGVGNGGGTAGLAALPMV
jgi:hypothetical protein